MKLLEGFFLKYFKTLHFKTHTNGLYISRTVSHLKENRDMKKIIILLISICLFSCKKEVEQPKATSNPLKDATKIRINGNETILKKETFKLEKLATLKIVNKLVVSLLLKETSKDGLEMAFYKLEFYNKETLVKSFETSIALDDEEGEWNINETAFEENNKFIEISYGYPACGYTQTNFLFFIDKSNCQLVAKNESMADGGYGTWTSYAPIFKENVFSSFTSKIVQIESDDSKPYNENNEDLIINYSDSIVYTQESNIWVGKKITPKGKIYRKESTLFNNYYKQDN